MIVELLIGLLIGAVFGRILYPAIRYAVLRLWSWLDTQRYRWQHRNDSGPNYDLPHHVNCRCTLVLPYDEGGLQ